LFLDATRIVQEGTSPSPFFPLKIPLSPPFSKGETDWDKAIDYYSKVMQHSFSPNLQVRMAYALFKKGQIEKADSLAKKQIKDLNSIIQFGRARNTREYYDLAVAHAFLGDKSEAYYYLHEYEKKHFFPKWMIDNVKFDPLLDILREDEEFNMIVKNMEEKYIAEHNRIKVWLEENEML